MCNEFVLVVGQVALLVLAVGAVYYLIKAGLAVSKVEPLEREVRLLREYLSIRVDAERGLDARLRELEKCSQK